MSTAALHTELGETLPFAAAVVERLKSSPLGGLLPGEKVVDLFCGAGGWGEDARRVGVPVDFAVNHSPAAIATHRLNNPACVHHQGDAWKARPLDVIGLGTKVGLLMASAACTTHSNARGKAPISKRVHMLGWCIARWMEDARPRIVMIENVVEWKKWGPLIPRVDRHGRPVIGPDGKPELVADPEREGQHYQRWLRFCKRLGYEMQERVIDAADVGGASRRKRLFLVGRCDGMPVCWPSVGRGAEVQDGEVETGYDLAQARLDDRAAGRKGLACVHDEKAPVRDPQHAEAGSVGTSAHVDVRKRDRNPSGGRGEVRSARCAADVIDWTDLGVSILLTPAGVKREKKAGRLKRHVKRPLEVKTLRRICVGVLKHVLSKSRPFVLRVTHGDGRGWHVTDVGEALPTQTTRQDLALVTPVVANNTSGHAGAAVLEPVPTLTTGGQTGLAAPVTLQFYSTGGQDAPVGEALPCVTTNDRHALATARFSVELTREQHRTAKLVGKLMKRMLRDKITLHDGCVVFWCDGRPHVMIDILFRMFTWPELARAMGFPETFDWSDGQGGQRSNREIVKMIGNAVHVDVAEALVWCVLPLGSAPERGERVVGA